MYIYKIVNKINGKIYIGQTTNSNPIKRIKAHFKKTKSKDLVRDAANKYGRDSLEWEILYCALDLNELNRAEQIFIREYNSLIPNGYNIQIGGSGKGKWSEASKIENGNKVREWYKTNSHPFKGKSLSSNHIESLSKSRKGFDSKARKIARDKAYEKARIPIIAINLKTKEELQFISMAECAKQLDLEATNISRVLRGSKGRTQHKGYTFKYTQKLLDKEG